MIDTNKEDIALKEARRLNIPIAAIVDTNCDPNGITFVVPGNDDAGRAISLYCDLVAKAAIDGISRAQGELGRRPRRRRSAGGRRASGRSSRRPASSRCRARAAWPTISRSCPACFAARSKSSSTTSACSTTRSSPSLMRHDAAKIGEEVGLPAVSRAGSPRRKSSSPSNASCVMAGLTYRPPIAWWTFLSDG